MSTFLDRVGSGEDDEMKQSLQRCLVKNTRNEKFIEWMCSEEEKTLSRMLTMSFFVNQGLVMVHTSQSDNTKDYDEGELITSKVLVSEELLDYTYEFNNQKGASETPSLGVDVPFAVELASSFLDDIDRCLELDALTRKGSTETDVESESTRAREATAIEDAIFSDTICSSKTLIPEEPKNDTFQVAKSQFEQELEALTLS